MLVWLLAVLLSLQAAAASVLAIHGPLHVHRASAAVVLEDVRRTSAPALMVVRHVGLPFGHFHAGAPERHRHAIDDASVVALEDGGSGAVSVDAALVLAALAGSAAIGEPFVCALPRLRDVRAMRDAWTPRTHVPAPPERPPRNG